MTFDRATAERLIAQVESKLVFGQLGPYAEALREALWEIDRHENVAAALAGSHARLRAEIDAMRPVVAVVEQWRDLVYPGKQATSDDVRICDSSIIAAVDAYRASKEPT